MKAIEVETLSKKYVISHQKKAGPASLRELFASQIDRFFGKKTVIELGETQQESEEFWALKDVSFDVAEGERIAIIGGNGAGKSTLLKILSRITEPTQGQVKIRGKVASLLEVGTGFHPELTGRENIFLNGAILGMRRSEIAAKFDKIVSFSGVEKFIDTPVKHYSSGMYVRLAFSVSAWLDPDILIVDEVLSVGDQAFQRRCAERMKELTGDGRTVLFVSHSMQAVKSMCEKALYLEQGRVTSFLPVEEATMQYIRSIEDGVETIWHRPEFTPGHKQIKGVTEHIECSDHIRCLGANVLDNNDEISGILRIQDGFKICIKYEVIASLPYDAVPNIHFYDEGGSRFFITFPEKPCARASGIYESICIIPPYLFNNGRYSAMVAISSFSLERPLHFAYENALRFEVIEEDFVDSRRHGWTGMLPGMARPHLDWISGVSIAATKAVNSR